jgi:glycosyltransferase involved in cell wall biosynthesis
MSYKNIVYLHPHFTLTGGAGKFVLETGKILATKGYKVSVISIKADKDIINDYEDYIEFIDVGGPLPSSVFFWMLLPYSYIKVARVIREFDDFILFPQVFPANWWGFVYKLLNPKTKSIWMCQEPSAFIHSKRWINAIPSTYKRLIAKALNIPLKSIDTHLASKVDLVIANSNYTKKYILQSYSYSDDKVKVAYLGVDLSTFRQDPKIKREPCILTVCRLSKFKNVDTLIKAFNKVLDMKPNLKLYIVGDGEEKENLENLVKRLKIADKVIFTGDVKNPAEVKTYYQKAQIFILCSIDEPFGIVPVEAMACGTPVIAFDSGGPSEVVLNGKTGLLLRDCSYDNLAKNIARLLQNPKILSEFSADSIARSQVFSWTSTSNNLVKYFEEVV